MQPLEETRTTQVTREALAHDVDSLLNPAEADGIFRDSAECLGLLAKQGGLALAPPAPRPKKG
ncbi:hypothetical protein V1J52_15825 [Streptomyces sp. TRM 70351]|nr:hypothetical protein [Streptomyces sp. TRM 70351]MEE1929635.1 hypothetical protein [Streptomyces sp. TRM 70351]